MPHANITTNLENYLKTLQPQSKKPTEPTLRRGARYRDVVLLDLDSKSLTDPAPKLGKSRRLTVRKTETKKKHEPLFKFIHKRKYELQVLLTMSSNVWDSEGLVS